MSADKCPGCDTPIPPGATNCPMCGAPFQSSRSIPPENVTAPSSTIASQVPETLVQKKKCKHCAMMVPKEAKICPHCRKRLTTSLFTKIVLAFILLPVLFSIFIPADKTVPSPAQVEQKKAGDEKYWAAYAAKEMISQTLKAPGSAEWQDITDFEVLPLAGHKNTWMVSGYVDAQNSYGAKLRNTFKAKIRKEADGGMTLVSLKMSP